MAKTRKRKSKKKTVKRRVTTARKNPVQNKEWVIYGTITRGVGLGKQTRIIIHAKTKTDATADARAHGVEPIKFIRPTMKKAIEKAKRNPIPLYIVRVKVTGRDTHYYFDGTRLVSLKPHAKKFSSVADAKHWGEKVYQMFPTVNSVGIIKA